MIAMFAMNGPWEWIIILVVVLIFSAGKYPTSLDRWVKECARSKMGWRTKREQIIDTTASAEQNTESYVDTDDTVVDICFIAA